MKPTAYVLGLVGLVMAFSALVLYLTANPYAAANGTVWGVPWGSNALVVTLVAGAGAAIVLAWAMFRFGGKGYTETNSPPRR
jgi:hypothetical protein